MTTATVKTSGDFFSSDDVGKSIEFADGKVAAIVRYLDPSAVMVFADPMPSEMAQSFKIVDAIWHRNGEDYVSQIQSGMDSFGASDMEKQMDGYVPILSSKSLSVSMDIALRGAINPSDAVDLITDTIPTPQSHNLIPVLMAANYIGDRVEVSGVNAPCELSSRIFRFVGEKTDSFVRI